MIYAALSGRFVNELLTVSNLKNDLTSKNEKRNTKNETQIIMNEALKNPILLLVAAVLAIWLILKVLKVVLNLGGIIIIAFILMFILNERFRNIVRALFQRLTK
jgi:ABC-type multidrug transport system fused ATPase/permease subunit